MRKKKVNDMKPEKAMKKAAKEALKAVMLGHGGPFGAAIARKGKIIATAHNTVLKENDATAHAEINAIRKASKKLKTFDLSKCEIYSACEPCPMCLAAIHWARIKKVYYACAAKDAASIGFDDLKFEKAFRQGKSIVPKKRIRSEKCLEAFAEWKKKPGKKFY